MPAGPRVRPRVPRFRPVTETLDWGDGDYERTAEQLEPVADVVLDAAGLLPGETVLDVACGTGNAALAAAQRGARAVGVDPAEALLELARERAGASALQVEFTLGDALALPVADGAFDAVVSVFGVIFAPDADRAASELLRATRAGGRVVLSSWVPAGPIAAVGRAFFSVLPSPVGAPPRWGDPEWATELLVRHGAATVEAREHRLPFTAASPEAWFEDQEAHHPVWRWGRRQLTEEQWGRLREESVTLLREANEDPAAFRTTSRYLVVTARR